MKQGDQMDESMKMDHSKHDHHEMNHSMNGHDHHNMNQEMTITRWRMEAWIIRCIWEISNKNFGSHLFYRFRSSFFRR